MSDGNFDLYDHAKELVGIIEASELKDSPDKSLVKTFVALVDEVHKLRRIELVARLWHGRMGSATCVDALMKELDIIPDRKSRDAERAAKIMNRAQ